MRTLGAIAEAARQLRSYSGILLALKVEFPTGNMYFTSSWEPSDVPTAQLQRLVTDWGEVISSLGEATSFPQSLGGVTIADPDGTIRLLWEDTVFQRLPCELYWAVWTPGQAVPSIAQSTSILRGAIAPPEAWAEVDLTMRFALTDFALRRTNAIGLRALRDDYPSISQSDNGKIIPLVYGKPKAVPAIYINGGPVARLVGEISRTAVTFYVDDASRFPQSVAIIISIDKEQIRGSFSGNTFTVLNRPYQYANGTTTNTTAEYATAIDTSKIGDGDNVYVGYRFRLNANLRESNMNRNQSFSLMIGNTVPRDVQLDQASREIVRFVSTTGKFEFARTFVLETEIAYIAGGLVADSNLQVSGEEVSLRALVPYTIRSLAEYHADGAEVLLVDEPADFIVGRGTLSVNAIYVHGMRKPPQITFKQTGRGVIGYLSSLAEDNESSYRPINLVNAWKPVPPELYSVVHTTHAGTGDPITIVRIVRRPRDLPGFVLDKDDILVDLVNTITNPAEVMEDICNTHGGMAVDFSAAATSLTNWHLDFASFDETTVVELLSDLAYQSRCALRWTAEDPELIYQYANGGTPVLALGRSNILSDLQDNSTFMMYREDIDEVYSQVTVNWMEPNAELEKPRDMSYTERDATVESTVGRRDISIDCWAHNIDAGPKALALYMLERHKHLSRLIETDVSIYGMALQPGDIVSVTHPVLPTSPEPGQIINIGHRVGRHPETIDSVRVQLRQFHWPGCGATSCQGFCESTGCETGSCQTKWQPAACWNCETDCQTLCQLLGCVTAAQLVCSNTTCQTAATTGCWMFCMPTTMVFVFGCGYCESVNCETTGCQTTNCETSSCQTAVIS